ncbi:MAG: hypothetical protein H0W97_05080, partial [Actinobacteria bacterium]|nr:hypothetical protein [Actinomycetota bacterium]
MPLSLKGQLLYLPQAAVGRLFGGPTEIVAAVDRFLLADGMADPRTASTEPRTAFESDYDFFVDGGGVIAGALSGQVNDFRRLTSTPWSRAEFAA